MGLEVSMKFSNYEEIVGIDPKKLLDDNFWSLFLYIVISDTLRFYILSFKLGKYISLSAEWGWVRFKLMNGFSSYIWIKDIMLNQLWHLFAK
jgi:hypothetical protein